MKHRFFTGGNGENRGFEDEEEDENEEESKHGFDNGARTPNDSDSPVSQPR
jgi:hypothetical protein